MARRDDLVVGGSGFLGAHVVAALVRRGGRVVSASRRPAAPPGATAPHEVLELDGSRPGAGCADLAAGRFGRVLLVAALSRVGDAARDPGLAMRLNRDWPAELAGAAIRGGARVVHVSTDLVFGGEPAPAGGFREEHAPAPLEPYGASKAAGEEAVRAACPGALVVRLPLLTGDSFGRGLGAGDSLAAALARGEAPTLFTDEWRTPLDAAEGARLLVDLADRGPTGLLHLGGPERLSRAALGARLLPGADLGHGTRADLGLAEVRAGDASLDSGRLVALCRAAGLTPPRAVAQA